MSDPLDPIQERMQQLGLKFARRTQGELKSMRQLVEQASQGDTEAVRSLELLAHKINGTGATFGLTAISNGAGEIERMASQAVVGERAFDEKCAARAGEIMAQLQVELERLNAGTA